MRVQRDLVEVPGFVYNQMVTVKCGRPGPNVIIHSFIYSPPQIY